MFGLFKKKDSGPKVDIAEIERQEREQRRKEMARELRARAEAENEAAEK